MITIRSGSIDGLRPPPAGSAFALGFTAGGGGADGGASTGVNIRVKSLGPTRPARALAAGSGGGTYGSARSVPSFA